MSEPEFDPEGIRLLASWIAEAVMRTPSDHYILGAQDRIAGRSRYKFQDPYLQAEYDRAYDGDPGEVVAALSERGEWPRKPGT